MVRKKRYYLPIAIHRIEKLELFAKAVTLIGYLLLCNSLTFANSTQTNMLDPYPNSILLFGGSMSTSDFGHSLIANAIKRDGDAPFYDNYIFGGTYQRDFHSFSSGFVLAGEIGIADRFGHYVVCCTNKINEPNIISSNIVHSGELWLGPAIRYDSLVLFNWLHIIPGITFGFSAVTNSIGIERGREMSVPNSNATFLGYLSPEVDLSLIGAPRWVLVFELHHRSGACGTFGNFWEGYNANVVGLRYRF